MRTSAVSEARHSTASDLATQPKSAEDAVGSWRVRPRLRVSLPRERGEALLSASSSSKGAAAKRATERPREHIPAVGAGQAGSTLPH